MGLLKEICIRF
jgi:hypothetical protein